MMLAGIPTSRALLWSGRSRAAAVVLAGGAVALLCVALLWTGRPLFALVWAGSITGLLALARWPVAAFYSLVGAALLIDQYRALDLEAYMGARLPSSYLLFWQTFGGVTAADGILVVALALLMLHRLHAGKAPLVLGPLAVPIVLLVLAVLFGLWRGMAHAELVSPAPFSMPAAVAEARAFIYLPLMYLFGVTAIDSARRMRMLIWVLVAATGIKALQTLWVVSRIGAGVFEINEVSTHEDSIYVAGLIVLAVTVLYYRLAGTLRHVLIALLPVAVIALVANHRRIAFIALGASLVVMMLMVLAERGLRWRTVAAASAVALALLGYATLFWQTTPSENLAAWPVYAVRSVTDPRTTRDVNSNLFREMENINLARTVELEPWLGSGFGRQYLRWIEQPLIDDSFTFWRYISHNSIYWVWVKLGAVGFVLFWYAVGGALAEGAAVFRRLPAGLLKAIALTGCCFIVMQMLYSYADLGLTSARNMVLLGGWMGALGALGRLARAEGTGA